MVRVQYYPGPSSQVPSQFFWKNLRKGCEKAVHYDVINFLLYVILSEPTKHTQHISTENMPRRFKSSYKRRSKRTFKRRSFKRKAYRSKRRVVRIPRSPPGQALPNQMICKFRYSEEISINPGAASVAAYVFRANSLYDPNYTGVGHQPAPYDQMKLFYKKFKVIGSKITVRPVLASATYETINCYLGIINSKTGADYANYTNVTNLLESKWGKRFKTIGNYTSMAAPNKKDAGYVSSTWSLKRDETRLATDNDFAHPSATNPIEARYFEIVNGSVVGNDPALHDYLVTIDYIAMCMDPEVVTQS